MALIDDLKKELSLAIDAYEQSFIQQQKVMPTHRANDVVYFRQIINSDHDDPQTIKELLQAHFSMMRTGWFVFKTGRSRLKNYLSAILEHQDFSILHFLREQMALNKDMLGDAMPFDEHFMMEEETDQCDSSASLRRENARLRDAIAQLNIEQKAMAIELDSLRADNDALKEQNSQLMREKIFHDYEEDSSTSPTITLFRGSFGSKSH